MDSKLLILGIIAIALIGIVTGASSQLTVSGQGHTWDQIGEGLTQEELDALKKAATSYITGVATEEELELLDNYAIDLSTIPEPKQINEFTQLSNPNTPTDNSGQGVINLILGIGMVVLFYLAYQKR